jgi:tetrahydromethanopterin S-methyltransferase subunit H
MNRIVRSWERSSLRAAAPDPDALEIDDSVFVFEEKAMPIQKELRDQQFEDVIRMLKMVGLTKVKDLKTATFGTLRRLKIKRDETKAVVGIPKGSDQHNVRTILDWLDKIEPEDEKAIEQLVAIDATATRRVKG